MKFALAAALGLAVTAAQAQQTQEKQPYGQQQKGGQQAQGQQELKISSPSEWQFHKADEKHKGVEATGNVQCAEPFGMMKGGLTAKVAKLEAGSRFKATAKEDMYVHVHEGSLSFNKAAGAEDPGRQQPEAGAKTAQAGSIVFVPAGSTYWVSAQGETTAVVFTKAGEGQTGEMESPEPKTDVK